MSIATKRGDAGQTGLAGGIRISKADLRVEAYGTVDELNTVLGFARSLDRADSKDALPARLRIGNAAGEPQAATSCHGRGRRLPDPTGVSDRGHGRDSR